MRSQSLFNFFTKAAAGGPRVLTGDAAQNLRASMEASARSNAQADNQRRTPQVQQRHYYVDPNDDYHGSEFGTYLRNYGNPEHGGNVRDAYSKYMADMRNRHARGSITREQLYDARSQARAHLVEDQFNRMWRAYQNSRQTGLSNQRYSRMINDSNKADYIFTPDSRIKGWNPGEMTYDDFEKFVTAPSGVTMSQEDAFRKWNNAVQARERRYDGRGSGRNSTAVGARPAVGSNTDESWRGEGFRQQQALEDEYAARKRDKKNPATPLTFKGGYAVNYNPAYVKDWTRPTGPTSNNVGGIWYTDEQYMAYKDVTNQLRSGMLANGMSQAQANAEASRLAKLYMDDQMRLAANHTANNKWMEQPPAADAPAAPANTPLSPKAAREAYQKELREMQSSPNDSNNKPTSPKVTSTKHKPENHKPEKHVTVGAPVRYIPTYDPLLLGYPKNFNPNATIDVTGGNTVNDAPGSPLIHVTPNGDLKYTQESVPPVVPFPEGTYTSPLLQPNIQGMNGTGMVPNNVDPTTSIYVTPGGDPKYTPWSVTPGVQSSSIPSVLSVNNIEQHKPIDIDTARSLYGDGFTHQQYHDIVSRRAYDNMIKLLYERLTPEQRRNAMASPFTLGLQNL